MSRKEQIKEFLTFTKGEKKGIIVLIILVLTVILINQFSHLLIKEEKIDFSEFKKQINEFEKSLVLKEKDNNKSYFELKYDTLQLFSFNPNNTSKNKWELLGLSEKQIKTVNNYLNKGGKFIYKNDFKKIYGISAFQFQKLNPYIDLPEKEGSYNSEFSDDGNKENNSEYFIPDVENYIDFNPNIISDFEWKRLGFSTKQITVIRKYLDKGGKFYKKEDLKKIYGIKEFQYERIKNYIKIPIKEDSTEIKEKEVNIKPKVNINNLSIEEMKKYGKFWQFNATRIVKYRNLLGGYYKKEQLLEVYGMKREYYLKVADDITIDKSKLEKININFAEVSELGRHPYITYKEAEKILKYRNRKGSYKNLEDLINKEIVTKSLYDKISPYLKVK
ncbi:MAG: helix-hairpin-helix domain-containing protein [Bacteroidales bacterium]|nr:helix-hairpin-helix domain-containing protein [Bacteroidales bacterium]